MWVWLGMTGSAAALSTALTRLSNNCDGRASTRREIGRLRVLIVVVTDTTKSVWG